MPLLPLLPLFADEKGIRASYFPDLCATCDLFKITFAFGHATAGRPRDIEALALDRQVGEMRRHILHRVREEARQTIETPF